MVSLSFLVCFCFPMSKWLFNGKLCAPGRLLPNMDLILMSIIKYWADFEGMVLLSNMASGFICLVTLQVDCPCCIVLLFSFVLF